MTDSERTLDLDAAREARAKRRAEQGWAAPVLRFAGSEFTLPDELPVEALYRIVDGDGRAALEVVLGGRFDEFWGSGPSRDDVTVVVGWMLDTYNRNDSDNTTGEGGD